MMKSRVFTVAPFDISAKLLKRPIEKEKLPSIIFTFVKSNSIIFTEAPMDHQDNHREQIYQAAKNHPIYRIGCISITVVFVSLLLGFAFFLIGQAIWFGFLWLGPYWTPSYKLLKKIWKPAKAIDHLDRLPITWWNVIFLVINSVAILCMIFFGIKILLEGGFLNQNLIWLIFKK